MEAIDGRSDPFPVTPGQLVDQIQALFKKEVFRQLRTDGPYLVRGVFADHSKKVWGSFYYGNLNGPGGNGSIRLKVPSKIRLSEERVYTLSVTPELSLKLKEQALELVFRVEALHEEGDLVPLKEEVKLPKPSKPKQDVRAILLDLLRKGATPNIALVVGETAIVDQDVDAGLKDARHRYRIDVKRVNLLDRWTVAQALRELGQGDYDLVALVRGGGEGLEVLDSPEVWEAVAQCPKPVVVALGHAANTLLVEVLADQSFPTPTAFGNFLRELVQTVEGERQSATLADLLRQAQEEAKVYKQEVERLKDHLSQFDREPASLAQELARLQKALGVWRAVALAALVLVGLVLLARFLGG